VLAASTGPSQPHAAALCLPIEPVAGDHTALNTALAHAHLRGVPMSAAALFGGRLTRAFVPASDKKFLVNPCERPQADVEPHFRNVLAGLGAGG
jgi:hypothetical protein